MWQYNIHYLLGKYYGYVIITLTFHNGNKYTCHDLPHSTRLGEPVPLSAVGYQSSSYNVWLINTISGTFTLECPVIHRACEVLVQLA